MNENYFGAQHVIALVDCHPDMFQKGKNTAKVDGDNDEDNETMTGIEMSLKLIQTLLQQTIEQTVIRKTGKRNGVGLLLYNTKTKRDSDTKEGNNGGKSDEDTVDDDDKMDDEDDEDDMDEDTDDEKSASSPMETTVHRLLDLKPPGIRHVQTLRNLLLDKRRQTTNVDLRTDFCPTPDDLDPTIAPLQTALEESTRMFLNAKCVRDPSKNAKGKNEYDTKSIWIFTTQANPYSNEKNQLIQNIANETKEQRIRIIVWPLVNPSESNKMDNDEEFDSTFFEDIASEILFEQRFSCFASLQDGLEGIYRTFSKKRRTHYGPMYILRPGMSVGNTRSVEDPTIMIDWYSVVQLSTKPGKVTIDTANKR